MAPKRPSPLDQPPAASSSEEEEASSEEASGSDESESEPEPSEQKKTTSEKKPESSTAKPDDSSSGETATDLESDSDSDTPANHRVNVKPISSLPMEEAVTSAAKSSRSKPAAASPATAKSGTKRGGGGESEVTKEAKKAKKKGDEAAAAEKEEKEDGAEEEEEDSKKSKLFQRIWCDEDEIIILKGMHEFKSKRGVDPYADMNGFHDFIKKSLNVVVSKNQLQDKIRRLKKKFENNVKKNKKPTKDHELKVFELSRKVWGGEEEEEDEDLAGLVTIASFANGEHSKSNGKMKSSIQKENKRTSALMDAVLLASPQRAKKSEAAALGSSKSMLSQDKGFKEFGLSESLVKQGLEKMEEAKRAELEYRWCKLHLAEMELFARRSELMSDQARYIVEAFQKSDH